MSWFKRLNLNLSAIYSNIASMVNFYVSFCAGKVCAVRRITVLWLMNAYYGNKEGI